MGLDMFLTKETYIGANYEHNNITGTVKLYKKGKSLRIRLNRISSITEEVAYWRKAWVIHKWFVDNVQDGVDNGGTYLVKYEQLVTLVNICKRILNDWKTTKSTKLAEELLPVNIENEMGVIYDKWYFDMLKQTVKMIDPVLARVPPKAWDITFKYHSSW